LINILEDFKGQTATEKILADATKILLENKSKYLGFVPRPNIVSLVHVEKPNSTEILQIGGSKPQDLLNQNFLACIGNFIRPVASNFFQNTTLPKQISGSPVPNLRTYDQFFTLSGGADRQLMTATGSCTIQIGSGGTGATREDFDIETAFISSPESNKNGIVPSFYNTILNQCEFTVSFGATGSGSIKETCLFSGYRNSSQSGFTFLMSRDNISSTPFSAGEIVFVNYTLAL